MTGSDANLAVRRGGAGGADCGPGGGRATVVQGGLFTAHGRLTTFAPSWRFITDLGSDSVDTVLAGGPSGRRFSRWYTTDVERWLKRRYKRIRFSSDELSALQPRPRSEYANGDR